MLNLVVRKETARLQKFKGAGFWVLTDVIMKKFVSLEYSHVVW
jgi:hypothetical protein